MPASFPRTCAASVAFPPPRPATSSRRCARWTAFAGKLELLNRGQRWVIRKIEENLATIADPGLRAFLSVMAKGHYMNIGAARRCAEEGLL